MANKPDQEGVLKKRSDLLSIKDPLKFLDAVSDLYCHESDEGEKDASTIFNPHQYVGEFSSFNLFSPGLMRQNEDMYPDDRMRLVDLSHRQDNTERLMRQKEELERFTKYAVQHQIKQSEMPSGMINCNLQVGQRPEIFINFAGLKTGKGHGKYLTKEDRERERRTALKKLEIKILFEKEDAAEVGSEEPEKTKEMINEEDEFILGNCRYKTDDFEINDGVKIHTLSISNTSIRSSIPPLVMIHGFGGAIPTFYKVYEELAVGRTVYGIDLPGFGLSTRVKFPKDPKKCEDKMISFIEQWRIKMGINKMILLGHSFGGYISACYTIEYSEHVHHLVLLDPWGVYSKKDNANRESLKDLLIEFGSAICSLCKISPEEVFKIDFGMEMGHQLVKLLVSREIQEVYGPTCFRYFVKLANEEILTGLKALMVISKRTYQYSVFPLKERLIDFLDSPKKVPITFLYGKESQYCKNGLISACELSCPDVVIKSIALSKHHVQVHQPKKIIEHIMNYVYS